MLAKHPLLVASPRRDWKTLLPYWSVPVPPEGGLPLGLWGETGSAGASLKARCRRPTRTDCFRK